MHLLVYLWGIKKGGRREKLEEVRRDWQIDRDPRRRSTDIFSEKCRLNSLLLIQKVKWSTVWQTGIRRTEEGWSSKLQVSSRRERALSGWSSRGDLLDWWVVWHRLSIKTYFLIRNSHSVVVLVGSNLWKEGQSIVPREQLHLTSTPRSIPQKMKVDLIWSWFEQDEILIWDNRARKTRRTRISEEAGRSLRPWNKGLRLLGQWKSPGSFVLLSLFTSYSTRNHSRTHLNSSRIRSKLRFDHDS